MAKIRKQWVEGLIEPDSRLTDGSNCDSLHYHSQIIRPEINGVVTINEADSSLTYKVGSDTILSINPTHTVLNNRLVIGNYNPGVTPISNELVLYDNDVFIYNPQLGKHLSLSSYTYMDKYTNSSGNGSSTAIYFFAAGIYPNGLCFSDTINFMLCQMNIKFGPFQARTLRRVIEFRIDGNIIATLTPSQFDLEAEILFYDFTVTGPQVIVPPGSHFYITMRVGANYDNWGYMVINVVFRKILGIK